MPAAGAAACTRCGASIMWAVTDHDKRMPVDWFPTADGTVKISTDGTTRRAHVLGPLEQLLEPPGSLHKAHFATCPYADELRRRAS